MNILITNIWLVNPGGTEVYVRDLAISLHGRGHYVEVYSPLLGFVAEEIRQAGIHVVDTLEEIKKNPDVIHGHHFLPVMDAVIKFPEVPVLYFLHDRTNAVDTPPVHKNIVQYVAVDYNCLDRLLIDAHIHPDNCEVLYNWVDTSKFRLRERIASKPQRALVFSNYGNYENHFKIIQEACKEEGIEAEGIGVGFGNATSTPENIIGNYDLVFAKAKAAMESLATGAGVIVCDYRGLAEMVTTDKFDFFRKFNFGMRTMVRPIDKNLIRQEIRKYNAEQNDALAKLIKSEADFALSVNKIIDLYHRTIKKHKEAKVYINVLEEKTIQDYLFLKNKHLNDQLLIKNSILGTKELQIAELNHEVARLKLDIETYKAKLNLDYPLRAAVSNLFVQIKRKIVGK